MEVLWPTSFSLWVRAVRAESRNGLHPLITGGSLIWNLRSPPNLPIFSLTLDIGLASVDLCILNHLYIILYPVRDAQVTSPRIRVGHVSFHRYGLAQSSWAFELRLCLRELWQGPLLAVTQWSTSARVCWSVLLALASLHLCNWIYQWIPVVNHMISYVNHLTCCLHLFAGVLSVPDAGNHAVSWASGHRVLGHWMQTESAFMAWRPKVGCGGF